MTKPEKLYKEIAKKIRLYESGPAVDSMERMGLKYPKNHGVSILHLRQIAQNYKSNSQLAAHLRQRSIREMRILAEMIENPKTVTPELAENIVKSIDTGELAEQHSMNLFAKLDFAFEKASEWIQTDQTFIITTGFIVYQRLAMQKKDIDDILFEQFFPFAEKHSENKSIHVRKAIARALRQAGMRNENLKLKVINITKIIQQKESNLTNIIGEEVIPLLEI